MPFVALLKETGERIDITQIEYPKQKYKYGDCVCQLCEAPLRIRGGAYMRNHFAHDPSTPCTTDYTSQLESPHYQEAKYFLLERWGEFPEYKYADIRCEVKIPEIKRVVDVFVTFPTGWKQAHEIQLAGITTNELEERTNDYEKAGIDVVWWLGKSAASDSNRRWCIEKFGCCFTLNFSA